MTLPRVYIACLASYNNGLLHGDWIDLDGTEDLEERIEEILSASPMSDAEEWAAHDHEYCGALGEYPGLNALQSIIGSYEACESRHVDWKAFVAFCDHQGDDITENQVMRYEETYAGQGRSLEEWCESFLEETGQLESIPENLRFYFNFHAYARDLEINDVFTVEPLVSKTADFPRAVCVC